MKLFIQSFNSNSSFSVLLPFLQYFVFAMKNIVVLFGMNPVVWIRMKMKEIIQIRREMGVRIQCLIKTKQRISWKLDITSCRKSYFQRFILTICFLTGKCQHLWSGSANAFFKSQRWKQCFQWEGNRGTEYDLPFGGVRDHEHGPSVLQSRAGPQSKRSEEVVWWSRFNYRRGKL